MEELEMNATTLNENELLMVDGGSFYGFMNGFQKVVDGAILGIGGAMVYVSGGAALADPELDAAMLNAGIDLFS